MFDLNDLIKKLSLHYKVPFIFCDGIFTSITKAHISNWLGEDFSEYIVLNMEQASFLI